MYWKALCGLVLVAILFGSGGARLGNTIPLPEWWGESQPDLIPICDIQGTGFSTPYLGDSVGARGVVVADLDDTSQRGFFMQDENCDADPASSDGIFVYLGERTDVVQSGDLVQVSGTAYEYYGLTEIVTSPISVTLVTSENPLPVPVELAPPFDNTAARQYYESLEGMYISLDEAVVVGPTSDSDETWLVRADLGLERVFHDDPLGTGELVCADDGGLFEITPEAKVGDQVSGLLGALDYSFGLYRLALTASPTLTPGTVPIIMPVNGSPPFVSALQANRFSIGTFNLANLFDTYDDPDKQDPVLSNAEYQRRLQKRALAIHTALGEPAIIAVQEAENLAVLDDLVARPEIESAYTPALVEGLDSRGLDVGLLYQADLISLLESSQEQGCTTLVDGLGPDGNQDMQYPQNELTCDSDGDGALDGNRLFSRPPLLARFQLGTTGGPIELYIIVNHFKSKVQDTSTQEYTLPRRLEQAQFVSGLVENIRLSAPGANIIVLGDLNDLPDSRPLGVLHNAGLIDLSTMVPRSSRYSYIYQGVTQTLDYVLVDLDQHLVPMSVNPIHINADYPAIFLGQANTYIRSSDHDPLLVALVWYDRLLYLPLVTNR